ncbi:MAG: sulfide:quinone oxidoreductase [Bacteriovoracaceae bacterium]|jgi:sulfide:quinone oxidoreductase
MLDSKVIHVLIVGGGTGGITVAARLRRSNENFKVTIIEPLEEHYYQPFWTLVGGGAATKQETVRPMKDVIPSGVEWIKDKVVEFFPEQNKVKLQYSSEPISYDYLVVSPGIQLDWGKVEGLKDSLGINGVCSNYSFETVDFTWEAIRNTKSGNAIFTFPNTPIKCGGAPQKIMWLAEEYFRKNGVRDNINVQFVAPGNAIFGVERYRIALEKLVKERNIITHFHSHLIKIDKEKNIAYFKDVHSGEAFEKEYSMIHVTPPQSSPDFIKSSPLSNSDGWVDVDKHSTQHNKYPNIFSLGDASSLPNAKTGASIRKQAPILVKNLIAHLHSSPLTGSYNGYASCPIVTGYSSLILAEFKYDGIPCESFPFDQAKPRWTMFLLKKYLLPLIYWWGMLKGRM